MKEEKKQAEVEVGSAIDVDIGRPISPDVLSQLGNDIYKIVNYDPIVLIVSHKGTKQVIRARIAKSEYKIHDEVFINHSLSWKNAIIDAIPTKVIKNDNPLDGTTNYTITFIHKGSKKPFTIGPATISKIVEELSDRGRILKKAEAADALTAIIIRHEDMNIIEVNDRIPTPGYYWVDNKIVGYDVSQRLDFDPRSNEEDKRAALECIEVLEGLQLRSKKKVAFPTILKLSVLAPFSFITKTQTKGVDDWLPWPYLYDTTDTGKTTLIINAVLAIWGKHDKEQNEIHFKGPGSVDTPSKFGITISQTTYPVLIDEIGGLLNDDNRHNNILLDMVKYSVQGKHVRSRFNENIPALSMLAFTSNDPPPQDEAYRRRFVAIQFNEGEKWTEQEKEEFKHWLNEENRKDKLKTLGDFVATYVLKHPELILRYSSYSWYEPATAILKEFYNSVDREPPAWIDLLAEQTIVQETSEEKQFELRGYIIIV
jgi:hypothetical protein